MRWIVGSDHAGLTLKRQLAELLRGLGDEIVDVGAVDEQSVDYPDFGAEVGRRVAADPEARGLVVCGSGIGITIAANKVAGVRAALVHDTFTAQMARAHNDANVIGLGSRVVGPGVAEAAVRAFRDTAFEGGRHAGRVAKLAELDRSRERGGGSGSSS